MKVDLLEIKDWIIGFSSLITAIGVICVFFKKYMDKAVEKITEPIMKKIDKLDENHCKDFLMMFLDDIENGVHKNEYEIARAHDVYNHYTNVLHKNSYIHARWTSVMENKEIGK